MAGKITIQTIAENCGVCIATVSRVLNGSSSVSESVRRKVLDYIEDTGWKSCRIRNRMFPVEEQIVPVFTGSRTLENEQNIGNFRAFLQELANIGVRASVVFGHRDASLRQCLGSKIEKLIVLGCTDRLHDAIDALMKQGTYVVALGEPFRCACPTVMSDHFEAGAAAAMELKRLGVKRPAFFAGFGMNRHGSSLEEIRIRRIADALRGILSVYPDFQMERQTVSDCFGDLGEFQRLFLSGNCDGWITFDAGRMTDFARLAVSYPQKLVPAVALLEGCSVPVPPFFSRFFCEDPYAKMRKLVTLYQQKAPSGEYPVSYKNISGKGEQR